MTSVTGDENQWYSCKCLNVRLRAAPTQLAPPDVATHPDYKQVYVGDQGIIVAHPHITLRNRVRGATIAGTSRCCRYTSLTCLICEVLVYRVHQIVSLDVEGKEGPLLPTEEWVEDELMKSSTGWVEVHNQALHGNQVSELGSSPKYSPLFSVVLPDASPPGSPDPADEKEASNTPTSSSPPATSYLNGLRPLFPPAPFTPSHPVFLYISALANNQSQSIRAAAEEYLADVVRTKISEIEQAEAELRQQVEVLWKQFRAGISKFEHDRKRISPRRPASRSRERVDRWSSAGNDMGSPSYGTPIAIRTFEPAASVPPAKVTTPPAARVSALSASLATTTFHHPRAHDPPSPASGNTASLSHNDGSNTSMSSRTLASQSYPVITGAPLSCEGSNVLQFRRSTNDAINTAVSFRYFQDLEADMARHKREQKKVIDKKQLSTDQFQQPEPSENALASTSSTNVDGVKSHETQSEHPPTESNHLTEGDALQSRGRDKESSKGKRKVTFDVQPAVVTIKREVNAENEEEAAAANQDTGDMIFDIEDEGSERSVSSGPTLPLVEAPSHSRPLKPRKARTQQQGMPNSFAALRPASLPTPSHIRPARGQHGVDSSSQAMILSLPRPTAPIARKEDRNVNVDGKTQAQAEHVEEPIDPQDAEILRLVAANTPSHRGAWKLDGEAWKTFVRRRDAKARHGNGDTTEDGEGSFLRLGPTESTRMRDRIDEDEDDTYNVGDVAASLPISINTLHPPPVVLSLASYQPTSALGQRLGTSAPAAAFKTSSAALRKAVYAERDRTRSMDPGALDFATEEESEDEDFENEEVSNQDVVDAGERGRKRALKILQARSELPEPGMWRSLAT